MKKIKSKLIINSLYAAVLTASSFIMCNSSFAQNNNQASIKSIPIDRIIAIVNNNIITQKELLIEANKIEKQLISIGKSINIDKYIFLNEVLERLITDKILLQRARDVGISISDAEFSNIVQTTAKKNNITIDEYLDAIKKAGVDLNQWKQDQVNNLVLSRLRQKEVEPLVRVSETEIDSYLSSLSGVSVTPLEKFHISLIYLPNGGNLDKEIVNKNREKAQSVLDSIINNTLTFKQAQQYYLNKDNQDKQNIIVSDLGSLPNQISEVLLRMNRQQLWPNLLETNNGFYILYLNDKKIDANLREKAVQIPQTNVRHILLRVAGDANEKEVKQRLLEIKNKIDSGVDMASLATVYSQDGSSSNGGNMGWVSHGEMVPEFEQAMNVLQPGKVSNPIRTDYGYHLIQVISRRIKSVGLGQQREAARQVLNERKTEIIYQDWVRNLREKAFVDIK